MPVVNAPVNRLIAAGIKPVTPFDAYSRGVNQVQRKDMNNLAMQGDRQAMGINQEKMQMVKQEHQIKGVASLAKYLDTIDDPVKKEMAFQAAIQKMPSMGIQAPPPGSTYESMKTNIEKAKMQVYGLPKGANTNVIYKGKLTNAIADEQGNYIDERTGETLYGAVKAPTRQETRTGELTSAQEGKELIDYQNQTASVMDMIDVAGEVSQIISASPSSTGGSGAFVSGVNEISQSVSGIVSAIRPDLGGDTVKISGSGGTKSINKSSIADVYSDELSNFRQSAIYSQELESALVNLGYSAAAAKGQTGRALSDIDLKMNMKEVGKVTDTVGAQRVLRSFIKRTVNSYKNKTSVKGDARFNDLIDEKMKGFDKLFEPDGDIAVENKRQQLLDKY